MFSQILFPLFVQPKFGKRSFLIKTHKKIVGQFYFNTFFLHSLEKLSVEARDLL